MDIIRAVWPNENPFVTPRRVLIKELQSALKGERPRLRFLAQADSRALFRYSLHIMATEVSESIGTSTLVAAWNATVYVAQIDDARLLPILKRGGYLEATSEALRKHGGLWFTTEAFVVVRDRD